MKLLLLSLNRAFYATAARYFIIVCLVATTITIYSGTFIGLDQLETTTAQLYQDLRLFDIELHTQPIQSERQPTTTDLSKAVPDIVAATWRHRTRAMVELPDGHSASADVLALAEASRPEVGDVLLTEGEFISTQQPEAIVIDKSFAAYHRLSVGSPLTLHVAGANIQVHVAGIAIQPECLLTSSNESSSIPIQGTSMMALMPLTLLERGYDQANPRATGRPSVNNLVLRIRPEASREHTLDALRAYFKSNNIQVTSAITSDNQYSVSSNRSRLSSYRDFLPTVLVILIGLTLFVLLLTIRRQIHILKSDIAIMLAIGISPLKIFCSWLLTVAVIIFIGMIFGTIGAIPLSARVTSQYMATTGFPTLLPRQEYSSLLQIYGLCLFLIPIAVSIPLVPILRTPPSALLHTNEANLPFALLSLVTKLDLLAQKCFSIPFPERMGIRNIVRRPSAFITTCLSVCGLLVVTQSMHVFADAMDRSIAASVAAHRWDYLVSLTRPIERDQFGRLMEGVGASDWEEIASVPVLLKANGHEKHNHLVAGPVPSRLRPLSGLVFGRDVSDHAASEFVLDLNTVTALGVKVGDKIDMTLGGVSHSMTLVGVVGEFSSNQAFTGKAIFHQITGMPLAVGGAVLSGPPALQDKLSRHHLISHLIPGRLLLQSYQEVTQSLASFIRFYGYLTAAVGILLVIILCLTNVSDRAREYGLLHSQGISELNMLRSVAVEIIVLALGAITLSIPFSHLATVVFQRRLTQTSGWYLSLEGGMMTYIRILVPVFFTLLLTLLPALRVIRSSAANANLLRARMG